MNNMSVVNILVHRHLSDNIANFNGEILLALATTAVFCTQSNIDNKDKSSVIGGNGVDKALLRWTIHQGVAETREI